VRLAHDLDRFGPWPPRISRLTNEPQPDARSSGRIRSKRAVPATSERACVAVVRLTQPGRRV